MKKKLCLTITTLGLAASTSLLAQPPHEPDLTRDGNRWTITAYDDSSPVHTEWATQGICFYPDGVVGSHQRYIWISDTYPDWNGRASQEGDQVFMYGDFRWPYGQNKDGGHDGMEWEIATESPVSGGTGHWKEWIEDGRAGNTIGFANAKLRRVGKCKHETLEEAFAAGQQLELPKDEQGKYLYHPMGVSSDHLSTESPN
ncbi:MAG: hypothetical protein P8163_06610 [Candidatus Thiodiazotropha sp.]